MRIILFFVSLALMFFSCNNKNLKIISNAEKHILSNPDSALKILDEIEFPEKLQSAEKADYQRIKSLSHFMSEKAMTDDSLIIYSLEFYKNNNIVEHLSETYMLTAMYYRWKEDKKKYFELLGEGLNFSLQENDSVYITRFYYLIGEELDRNKKYPEAIDKFKKVIAYDKNAENDLYYLIGLSFANLGIEDSTAYYLNKSIEVSLLHKDSLSAYHFSRNFADILYSQNKYEEALLVIRNLLDHHPIISTNLYTTASSIYLMQHKYDSAQIYLDKAKDLLHQDNSGYLITKYNSIMSLQSIINYVSGTIIDRTAIGRFNDSIWIDNQKKNHLIEEKINTKNQLEHQNILLTLSKQRAQMLFLILLLLFVICFGCVFFFLRNKRFKLEELEEKKEALQFLLDETIKNTNGNNLFFKKVLLQQLGLIKLVATSPTTQNQDLLRQMAQITNEDITVDLLLVWEDLYNTIDSIYDNFYSNTVRIYEDLLIEKEIQLCCLLCAEFSTKEISVVTQQSVRTIYQRKTTIRQKLKMDEKDDIIHFLTTHFKG